MSKTTRAAVEASGRMDFIGVVFTGYHS